MTIGNDYTLFSGQAADGNGSAIEWPGGRGVFAAWGTFGGGMCKLQWSPDDGGTWLDVDAPADSYVTLVVDGAGGFELPACSIRASLSGATGAYLSANVTPMVR